MDDEANVNEGVPGAAAEPGPGNPDAAAQHAQEVEAQRARELARRNREAQHAAWKEALKSKGQQPRPKTGSVPCGKTGKGIGPNKASGHKGGMGRQGSKRG